MAVNINRGIRIVWACSHYVLGKHDGVRVRIDAVSSCLMPIKVFAYRMLPTNPDTGQKEGYFSHICSPPDLADFPEDNPVPARRPEWFRLSYVDILLRSVSEAEDFVLAVREDVHRLKATLDTMDTLIGTGTEDVGDLPCIPTPPGPSSSESSSSEAPEPVYGSPVSAVCENTYVQGLGLGASWEAVDGAPALYRGALVTKGNNSQWLLLQGFPCLVDLPEDCLVDGIAIELYGSYETICPPVPGPCPDDPMSEGSCAAVPAPVLRSARLYHPVYGFSPTEHAVGQAIDSPMELGGDTDLWGWPTLDVADLRWGDFGVIVCVSTTDPGQALAVMESATLTVYYRERI